jgi:DNA-binding beta-propeller fold protein YncE
VTELTSSGSFISTGIGYTGVGLKGPIGIALDPGGNAWVANEASNSVTELSALGAPISPVPDTLIAPDAVAIDGASNAWIANAFNVIELGPGGSILSGPS